MIAQGPTKRIPLIENKSDIFNLKQPGKKIPTFSIDQNGTPDIREITTEEILHHFPEINSRDLRTVSEIGTRQISTILVRENFLVVRLEHIGGIIGDSRVLVFQGNQPIVRRYTQILTQILRDTSSQEPFEFRVLETMLSSICQHFENRYFPIFIGPD